MRPPLTETSTSESALDLPREDCGTFVFLLFLISTSALTSASALPLARADEGGVLGLVLRVDFLPLVSRVFEEDFKSIENPKKPPVFFSLWKIRKQHLRRLFWLFHYL